MKRIDVDQDLLRDLIEHQQLQQEVVAKTLGLHETTLRRKCRQYGIKTQRTGPRSGSRHTGWKGGIQYLKGYRYVYCPDHPHATKAKRVAEHRLVMEQKLGRYLLPDEVVHHINGDILDNRPENLEVFQKNSIHLKYELAGKCPRWTQGGLERIREGNRNKDYSYLQERRFVVDHDLLMRLIADNVLIKSEIAGVLGCSTTTIDRYCKAHGIRLNWKSRRCQIRNSSRNESERDVQERNQYVARLKDAA